VASSLLSLGYLDWKLEIALGNVLDAFFCNFGAESEEGESRLQVITLNRI